MHRPRPISALTIAAPLVLALAACGTADASPSSGAASPSAAASEPAATTEPATASVAASATAEATAGEEEVRVRLDGFAFDTAELTIVAGTEVTFLNTDAAAHTVTEGVDGVAAEGARFDIELAGNQADSVTFDEPGTYQVTCLFHPTMNMTVIVKG